MIFNLLAEQPLLFTEFSIPSEDEFRNDTVRHWHSGPPPCVGWWNASTGYCRTSWRYWNGSGWSNDYLLWHPYDSDYREPSREQIRARAASRQARETIRWRAYQPPWGV